MYLLLSLAYLTLPLFHWEVVKVWVYIAFIVFFAFFVLLLVYRSNLKINLKNDILKLSLFIFLLVSIFSSIFGVNLVKSILGNYYRADGLITLLLLAGFAIILGAVYQKGWKRGVSFSIFLSAVISSIWNNFGQTNFLVGFILISLPFGIYLFKNSKNKISKSLIILGFLIQFKVIILASSNIGLLGIILLFPLWKIIENRKYIKYLILPIIITILFFIDLSFKEIRNKPEYVAENRVRVYRNIFLGSLEKPILGYGWANTDYAFKKINWPLKFNDDIYVDKAHMLFLDIFSNTGIIGLISFVTFIFLVLQKIYIQKNSWSNVLFLSILMHLFYSGTNVTSISEEFVFWTVIGIIFSI